MVLRKRGQFFLLAAVIISAFVISVNVGTNKVTMNKEPGSFYDFSYEVKREVGSVLDYEVYSGFDGTANLTEFVDLLAKEIEERSPGSDFIFVYGNSTNMQVRNYRTDSIYLDGVEVEGLNAVMTSLICLESTCQDIDDSMVDFDVDTPTTGQVYFDGSKFGSNSVSVEIEGNEFNFPMSEHRQVVFIMQKNVGGDRHIVIE